MDERAQKLREALLRIEDLGAENPDRDTSIKMWRIANTALSEDDKLLDAQQPEGGAK